MSVNPETTRLAVDTHFTGEAAEMICMLGVSAVLGLCSLALWLKFSDQFSMALSLILLVIRLLLGADAAYKSKTMLSSILNHY